jgi:hypothetical protein
MIVAKRFHLLRRCELKSWKYKKVVIFLITFFIYTINFRYLGTSDTVPNVYVAISLINEGNFDLDEFKGKVDLGNVVDYNNKTLSQYPVITPIVATPFLFLPETLFHVSKNPMNFFILENLLLHS